MSKITLHGKGVTPFLNYRAPATLNEETVYRILSSIDTPRALSVWLLYSGKTPECHDQLTRLDCKPSDYNDGLSFRDDYTATKLLSKAAYLTTSFDKKAVAMEKFSKFENECRLTNTRFQNLSLDPSFNGPNCWLLNATISKIAKVLGSFSGDEFFDSAGWGPGVTTLLKGSYVSAINKFHLENGITRDLHSLVGDLFHIAYPLWNQHLTHLYGGEDDKRWDFQVGNSVVTVPKDSRADRVIAVEPGINLWFQKSIGSMIRRRLLRFSIDLNTQEFNQQAAYDSSRDGRMATVDFSSASDSISREMVREIIPADWLTIMESCRSKYGVLAHGPVYWEKFSSMGNGFTFELESLIFYAAACAVHEYYGISTSSIKVFGDDVIISKDALDLFSSFSSFLGFTINQGKSFSSGYFRESCGSHFWNGIDCKPLFIKERSRNVQAIYKLANGIRLLAHRRNFNYGCDRKFLDVHRYLQDRVPKPLRLKTSLLLGDVGFASNLDEANPSRARHGIEGFRVRVLQDVGLTDSLDSPAVLMARLWLPSVSEMNNSYTLRGRTKLRLTTVLVSQWCNFGPWL